MRMTAPAHVNTDMGYLLVSGHPLLFTFCSHCRKTGVGSGTAEIGGATGIPGLAVTPSDFTLNFLKTLNRDRGGEGDVAPCKLGMGVGELNTRKLMGEVILQSTVYSNFPEVVTVASHLCSRVPNKSMPTNSTKS